MHLRVRLAGGTWALGGRHQPRPWRMGLGLSPWGPALPLSTTASQLHPPTDAHGPGAGWPMPADGGGGGPGLTSQAGNLRTLEALHSLLPGLDAGPASLPAGGKGPLAHAHVAGDVSHAAVAASGELGEDASDDNLHLAHAYTHVLEGVVSESSHALDRGERRSEGQGGKQALPSDPHPLPALDPRMDELRALASPVNFAKAMRYYSSALSEVYQLVGLGWYGLP